MNKFLFMAAFAGVALASCTNNENFYEDEQQAISFAPVNYQNQSRAAYAGGNYGVYAWIGADAKINTTAFMEKVEINYSTGAPASGQYYWPKGYNLDFFAFSPYTVTPTSVTPHEDFGSNQVVYDNYTTGNLPSDVNLLYSDKAIDKTSENNGSQAVDILFNHALSKVVFKVQGQEFTDRPKNTTYEVRVNEISITSLLNKGTLTLTLQNNKTKWTPSWSCTTDKISSAWKVTNTTINPSLVEDTKGQQLTTEAVVFEGSSAKMESLVIPQTIPGEAEITIIYNVNTKITDVTESTGNNEKFTKTFKLNTIKTTGNSEIKEWKPNQLITYTLKFDLSNSLQPITFASTVEEWTSVEGSHNITK